VLAGLLALPAVAKEGDTFRPFVSAGYFFDSNLFRLDENENPGTQRDDRYAQLRAGVNVDWTPGRQRIAANVTKTRLRYAENTFLDFEGDDTQATWNWRMGNRLSGDVGASQSSSQSSFDSVGLVNNQVDQERRFGRAEWAFHPRWVLGGGLEESGATNSAPNQISQNFQQKTREAVLTYRTPKGSSLRGQLRRVEAEFPNAQVVQIVTLPFPPFASFPTEVVDNSYSQTEYNVLADWQVSGKLTLRGRLGQVNRQYDNINRSSAPGVTLRLRPEFNGVNGRLSGDWLATGKTLFSGAVYQELSDALDINATSVLRTGVNLSGVWLVREKWRLNGSVTFDNRDFEGDAGVTQTLRNDDTLAASLSVSYTPHPVVSFDVGLQGGRRDTNISGEAYEFHSLFANIRADF
jgi:exopolysaccharide biosynthesis operon protein EpsL